MKDGAKKMKGDLTAGPVSKVILSFTFPMLIANLLQQLYNFVDSVIVGQFVGKQALAAVSASFFIYFFLISLIIGVGSGITVLISQYYGARKYEDVQRAFSSFFIFMFFAGIILSLAGVLLAEPLLRLIKTPGDVLPEAVAYFRIYVGGTFVFVAFNSFISVMRGMGDSTRPMLLVLMTAILNIILDAFFIVVMKWGVEGAAIATVLAQFVGVGTALAYVHRHNKVLSLRRRDMRFDKGLFLRGLKIGIPTSVQQCSMSMGLMTLVGIVNTFGTDTLTAYGAAGKVESLINQAMLALSGSMAAFCGQNIGARNMLRIHQGMRFALLINATFTLAVFGLLCFFGRNVMNLFNGDEAVITIGNNYLLIVGSVFVLHGTMMVLNGAMRGAGDTLFAMVTGIVSFWLIRIPLAYLMSRHLGSNGIWWAVSLSLTLGFTATLTYYLSGRWKRRKVI